MKIVWIILLIIVLLIAFLLFCPFCVKLVYNDEVTLKVGYFFPIFQILPKKPKPDKPEKKSKEKSEKKEAESAKSKKKAPKKKNAVWEFTKKQGLDGLIELLKQIVEIVVKLVDTIRKHLVISKLRLDLLVVGEDPADTAMKYGYACSAIYPMLSILDRYTKIRRHEEYIDAGFDAEKTKVQFVLKVHIMPIFIIIAAVAALIGGVRIFRKLKQ